ncbi:MAG: universal stress protein [Rhodoblastus sp.]|nr:MAG: universal stress protein [Rhodoblastus sp.]
MARARSRRTTSEASRCSKILVPVDLAEVELSSPALAKATEMAKLWNAELRLINIQSLMPATFMDYVPAGFDEEQRSQAEKTLAEIAGSAASKSGVGDRVSTVVRVGGVYPEILAEAEAWGADLIVIGSHRPAMSTYLIGSNAKTVVRHARCSVLVVRV